MNADNAGGPRPFGTPETARSLLRLDLPAGKPAAARRFQTFELPELLMRGFRQSFTPSRSLRSLHRQSSHALLDAANGDLDPGSAAERIDTSMRAATRLEERWEPVATTVDRFFVLTMIREDGYIDQMADVFASLHPAGDRNAIHDDLADRATELQSTVPRADVLEVLESVAASHGRVAAEAVADIALDAPRLLGPSAPKRPIEAYEPAERVAAAADALSALADVDTRSKDDLETALRTQVDEGAEPPEAEHPLLDIPTVAAEPVRFPTPDAEPIPLSSAATDQVIARAFRQGGFGVVIHDTPEGSDWTVNPSIAAEPISEGRSYGDYWMRAYVISMLAERIRAATATGEQIRCPLCAHATNRCGGDTCGCQPLFESVESVVEPLIQQTGD